MLLCLPACFSSRPPPPGRPPIGRAWRRRAAALLLAAAGTWATPAVAQQPAPQRCLSDCTSRIGIVSAFGAEADLLVAETRQRRTRVINGNRFTSGRLRGQPVVIVLSGVSMINSAMVTQLMLDHFRIERLVMSGIAGGVNPAHRVGDVTVPDRWLMPMEIYWHHDSSLPAPCGAPGDLACLGLRLAEQDGKPLPPFVLRHEGRDVPTGWHLRSSFVMNAVSAPQGEYRHDYPVDPEMLEVARQLQPALARCGPRAVAPGGGEPDAKGCVREQPRLIVGGRGVSGTAFLAHPDYRRYLHEVLGAETVEMETAALAHVAYANRVPYIAFRSLSDLAGAEEFNADVAALFTSGLAEHNEAAVTLAFIEAWRRRGAKR